MREDYFSKMNRWENEYRSLLDKAEYIRKRNDGRPTKEEGYLYQNAAELCGKMAASSVDAEKEYWIQQQRGCNEKLRDVAYALDPKAVERLENRARGGNPSGASAEGKKSVPSAAPAGGANANAAVSDELVASWFKEAPGHGFEAVSGMADLKERLMECVRDVGLSALNEYLGMSRTQSFLFYGPPGCGKTFIVKAFAHELMKHGYKYMSLSGGDILSRYVGDAEKIIERIFEEAQKAPTIVFIDELDGVCRNRSLPHLPEYASSMTTAFLAGYNSLSGSEVPVIFIGATNYPKRIDNAMLDRVELVRLPLPDAEARENAFRMHLSGMLQNELGFTYRDMGEAAVNYNYRDIDRMVDKVKRAIKRDVAASYEKETDAVNALKEGGYCLSRALFEKVRATCLPTPRDDIEAEMDEWEELIARRMGE